MPHFVYFGYGSNMLTQRLAARCESAQPLGIATLANYSIEFSKQSTDRSGKAMLVETHGELVHGIMFEILLTERKHLDKAEGLGYGYDRKDDVQILYSRPAITFVASTCITLTHQMDAALKPYDWFCACSPSRSRARHPGQHACYRAVFPSLRSVTGPSPPG